MLRYIVDLPEAEVAAVLGMSAGSVKTHLHRAILRLRDQMSKEESSSRAPRADVDEISEDHMAELLERSVRRGTQLRRRTRPAGVTGGTRHRCRGRTLKPVALASARAAVQRRH